MTVDVRAGWIQRLRGLFSKDRVASPDPGLQVEVILPTSLVARTEAAPRSTEDWRDLLVPGRPITLSWDAGGGRGELFVRGAVRLQFEDALWIWLDREIDPTVRPAVGQVVQVLAPREDALRLVPCRLVEETQGGSLQLAVTGRMTRVQRRDDVRARVDLPPVSAVRLAPSGRPLGLLGVRLRDLSAGGLAFDSSEPLRPDEELRLVLHLDDGPPLTPTVRVLEPGLTARGQFAMLPERERRRIVQFVYRQELAERRRLRAERDAQAD